MEIGLKEQKELFDQLTENWIKNQINEFVTVDPSSGEQSIEINFTVEKFYKILKQLS